MTISHLLAGKELSQFYKPTFLLGNTVVPNSLPGTQLSLQQASVTAVRSAPLTYLLLDRHLPRCVRKYPGVTDCLRP